MEGDKATGACPWGPKSDGGSTAVETPNESELGVGTASKGGAQQGRQGQRPSRRNKRVYKTVDLAAFASEPAPRHQPSIAPADYRFQTNGVPPISIRNPEYAPISGRDLHQNFGNLFQNMAPAGRQKKNFEQFAMKEDEFPTLKK